MICPIKNTRGTKLRAGGEGVVWSEELGLGDCRFGAESRCVDVSVLLVGSVQRNGLVWKGGHLSSSGSL